MSKQSNESGGIGFCGLLTIVFITLKLCKVIEWSWWWVWSPIWVPASLALSILAIVWLIMVAAALIEHLWLKK